MQPIPVNVSFLPVCFWNSVKISISWPSIGSMVKGCIASEGLVNRLDSTSSSASNKKEALPCPHSR